MYETARSLAVEAGDTNTAMDAIDGLIQSFDGANTFLDKATISLQALSRKARNDKQYAEVARGGLLVVEQLVAAGRQEDAMDLLTSLRNSAMRSRRPELINTYKEMAGDLRTIREEADRIEGDLIAIKRNPDDPMLNLSVGKYVALYRGNWEKGLEMLAKSSDDALSAVAMADLVGARDAKTQIALGDQWWDLASKHSKIEERNLKERAKYWYIKALPSTSGIERGLLTKRLSPPGQITWGDLVLEPGIRTVIEIDGNIAGAKPGPISEEAKWEINKKPAGAKKTVRLHFEGYLYFPRTLEVGLKTSTKASSIIINVNGRAAVSGNGGSEAPVQLVKGYNAIYGTIIVPVTYIDNPDLKSTASISLTELDGKAIPIPAEHWFHDVTR